MKLKLFVVAILLTSLVAGCMGQKEITEKPTVVEEKETAEQTPTETPAEVQEITTLEDDINEVNDLLNELQELEELDFEV